MVTTKTPPAHPAMSPAARSVFVYSFYLFGMGALMFGVPNQLLVMLGFAPTQEPWVRVLGLLALAVGWYYFASSRAEQRAFLAATVAGRIAFFVGTLILPALGLVSWTLAAVGSVDLAGALWTAAALRSGTSDPGRPS